MFWLSSCLKMTISITVSEYLQAWREYILQNNVNFYIKIMSNWNMKKTKINLSISRATSTSRFCRCLLFHVKQIASKSNLPYSFRFESFDHCTMHTIACKSVCVTYLLTSVAFTGCQNTFGAAIVVYIFRFRFSTFRHTGNSQSKPNWKGSQEKFNQNDECQRSGA